MVSSFAKFENFENALSQLFSVSGWSMIKNSLIFDAVNLFLLTPITLIFSFYIYKKCFMSKFFKVMLFMPYILSEIIVATLYRCMLNNVIPEIMSEWFHVADTTKFQLLTEESTKMGAAIVFNIIMWFGINSLIYSSSMGDINASMSEAAQLDGATEWRLCHTAAFDALTLYMQDAKEESNVMWVTGPAGIGIGIRTCSGGSPHQTKNGGLRRAGVSIETGTRTETGSGGSHHPRVKSGVRPRNRHRMLSLAQDASTRTRRKNKNCLSCKTFSKLRQIPQASTCIRAYRKNPAADSELQRDFSARQEFPVPICGKQAFRRRQGVRLTKSSRPRTPAACPPEP